MSEEIEKENDIFKSRFEGIFLISQNEDLLKDYKVLIQKLNILVENNLNIYFTLIS